MSSTRLTNGAPMAEPLAAMIRRLEVSCVRSFAGSSNMRCSITGTTNNALAPVFSTSARQPAGVNSRLSTMVDPSARLSCSAAKPQV